MSNSAPFPIDRRTFNAGLLAAGTSLMVEGAGSTQVLAAPAAEETTARSLPTIFVAHGSPQLAIDKSKGAPFAQWGQDLPTPRAILVVSAHWEKSRPVMLSSTNPRELVYDFGGFPRELYEVRYDAPGAGELATRIESMLP